MPMSRHIQSIDVSVESDFKVVLYRGQHSWLIISTRMACNKAILIVLPPLFNCHHKHKQLGSVSPRSIKNSVLISCARFANQRLAAQQFLNWIEIESVHKKFGRVFCANQTPPLLINERRSALPRCDPKWGPLQWQSSN